jgi:hypothetical protein
MRSVFVAALLGLAAFSLAACSSSKHSEVVNKLNCPAAFIAPGLDSYTVFRPGVTPSLNTNDIVFGVKLLSVSASCHNELQGVRVVTLLRFVAVRKDDNFHQGDFTYFVAIADARQNIIAKRDFALRVNFASHEQQMRVYDDITEHLPLKNISLGNRYSVIVGLQVSRQQLELNRQRQ